MSTNDQPGKDLESGAELLDLRKLYDDVIPSSRVILTLTDKDLNEHHAVVPIPKSYEAAIAIAIDQLGAYIPTNRAGSLEGAYFQYWMRSPGGDVIWAKLASAFWKEIVRDGDQLKLFFPPPAELFATFVYHKLTLKGGTERAVVPLPKSYEEAVRVALEIFDSYGLRKTLEGRIGLSVKKYGSRTSPWPGLLDRNNWTERLGSTDVPVEIDIVEW